MNLPLHHAKSTSLTTYERAGAVVTPSDTEDLATKCVVVTNASAGTTLQILPIENEDGEWITFEGVHCGFVPPYFIRRVGLGTTCTVATIGEG